MRGWCMWTEWRVYKYNVVQMFSDVHGADDENTRTAAQHQQPTDHHTHHLPADPSILAMHASVPECCGRWRHVVTYGHEQMRIKTATSKLMVTTSANVNQFHNSFTGRFPKHTHTRTRTHTFNGPLSGTTRVSRYQKGKTNLDFTGARDSEWH